MYGGDGDGVMYVWRRVCRTDECMKEMVTE